MKKIVLGLLLACTTTIMAQQAQNEFTLSTVTDTMIKIKGTDDGMVVSPYEGKIVFLEFWGEKCGPCLMSMPHHVHLQEKYKDDLRIVAIEVSGGSKEHLKAYANDPGTHINMEHVSYFLNKKAKSKAAKDSLQVPIEELKKFKKSGKKLNYDIVSTKEDQSLVQYVMQRTGWQGYIPFLLVLDQNGKAIDMVGGMADEAKLEEIIKKYLPKK